MGIHLYGIFFCAEEHPLGCRGLKDGEVYSVGRCGIAVAVSHLPSSAFTTRTREELLRGVVAHQRVLEEIMLHHTVLPVKFGTILQEEAEVRLALEQGKRPLAEALEAMQGKVEVEVVATWNLEAIFQSIAAEPSIARLKQEIAQRGDQETTQDRIELGRLVKAALEARRVAYQREMLPLLQEAALELQLNPRLGQDSVVINAALLLDGAGSEGLERCIQALDQRYEGRLSFRCVGPLPPYSFATVEVMKLSFEELEEARLLLRLPRGFGLPQLKASFRHRAHGLHPDTSPERLAPPEFPRLVEAYHLLEGHCLSHPEGWRGNGAAFQVQVRRASSTEPQPLTME